MAEGRPVTGWRPEILPTARGEVALRLAGPDGADSAVIMVGGVGGGFDTPAGDLYPRLGTALAERGIAACRVRFRYPTRLPEAAFDVTSAFGELKARGVRRAAFVGHSFGGAVVIDAAATDPAVVAVVALATQSAGTHRVTEIAPRPILLLHGSDDRILPPSAARQVAARAGEVADVRLFDGAGHGLDEVRDEVYDLVLGWVADRLS